MRLIDADKFISHLKDWLLHEAPYGVCEPESPQYKTIKECIEAVEEQPTAYDVDKVVEQILNITVNLFCDGNRNGGKTLYATTLEEYRRMIINIVLQVEESQQPEPE